jgi:folate-binding protein YgfZ
MYNASDVIWLDDLGMVRARGADAVRFLQGQLSNDVTRLTAGNSLLAGYHNPQGRAIALLRLVYWDEGDVLAVVPRELAVGVASRLSKFVLRSKVKITDESSVWRIGGLIGATKVAGAVGSTAVLPAAVNAQVRVDDAVLVRVGAERALVVASRGRELPVSSNGDTAWRALEIESGHPQVYAVTSEEFVAQMLNLDVLDAIAFDKGCYTGQEVIARAHYRGRVKRRMQRFISREPSRLSPGDAGQLADGRSFKVVLAAQLADGRCDFLAVAPLPGGEREAAGAVPLASGAAPTTGSGTAPSGSDAATAPLAADPAPLPYALPD